MVTFVTTGVEGLDALLGGGFRSESAVLVSGNPGTGKSIFGIQYLYHGATEEDERGIYVSFEEDADDIQQAAESIGFGEWESLVESGNITVYDKRHMLRDGNFSAALDRLLDALEEDSYDRLVLDSLSMFQLFFEDEQEQRTYLLKFTDILKDHGLTSVLINEQGAVFPKTEVGLENYLTDGNVYFIQTPTESGVNRYVWVAKMRKQDIDTDIYPMEIGEGGITVHEQAGGFSLMSGEQGVPGASGADSDAGPSF
ncbi:MAG: ATPase domain-containing protein [Haloferacaceae archaeon]